MLLAIVLQQTALDRDKRAVTQKASRSPTSPEAYLTCGVIPPDALAGTTKLSLDLVRRSVATLIYEDRPAWLVTSDRKYKITDSFDLNARLVGRDQPTEALRMVGWKRLAPLQDCIEQVLLDGVPGDLIAWGVMRGGADAGSVESLRRPRSSRLRL